MADFDLDITTLCVGQGLSVLIELKYQGGSFVGLLDCGTAQKSKTNYKAAITKIKNAIINNGNKLNYLHISHFDKDHYNLLEILSQEFGRKIPLDKVVFGSVADDCSEIREKVETYKRTISEYFEIDQKNIYSLKFWYGLRRQGTYGDPSLEVVQKISYIINDLEGGYAFKIVPLIFHAQLINRIMSGLSEDCPVGKGVPINAGSTILLITLVKDADIPQASYIFTGDAIAYTYRILNAQENLKFGNEKKMLLISHHGAIRKIAETRKDIKSLDDLLTKIQPTAAVVSAQSNGNWEHPNSQVIAQYKKFRSIEQTDGHKFTSLYKQDQTMWVQSYNMEKRIYQTCYIDNLTDQKSECSQIIPDWKRQHIIMHIKGENDSVTTTYDSEPIG